MCCAPRLLLALLLLQLWGCASTATTNGVRQIDSNASMFPACMFWCIGTKSLVFQEGAHVSGGGTTSISKPISTSISEQIDGGKAKEAK